MRRELEKIGYLIGANIARASNPHTTNLSRQIQWEFQLCSWFVQDTWIPLMPVIFNFIFKCYLFEGYCRHPYLQTT